MLFITIKNFPEMMPGTILTAGDPVANLAAGLLFLAFILWLFWPERGGMAMLSSARTNRKRVRMEDALKYLFDCEYKNQPCEINRLAGNLNTTTDKASEILQRLIGMGLVSSDHQSIYLTDTGRSYALRVIRMHRVWEKFLADETGFAHTDWHREADKMEHVMTEDTVEQLAARMGNPVFDPHGDPIPTSGGDIPEHKGTLLSALKEGDMGIITHLEDEPKSIYEQLVVDGLYAGMQIYVSDVTTQKVTFVADGEEISLTPLFASQVTVVTYELEDTGREKFESLSSLEVGQSAEIAGISPNCRGQQRRRLMDLGMVPGTMVSAVIRSASGDPVGYRVMGTTIGIRKNQSDLIFIKNKTSHEPK